MQKTMKTSLIRIIAAALAIWACCYMTACKETVVMYEDSDKIYFPKDSLYYTFGTSALSVTSYTYHYPVKVLGNKSSKSRRFKVSVVADRTTAVAGTHYAALESEYEMAADSVNGFVPIVINRAALDNISEFKLVLQVESNADFGLRVANKRIAIFQFTNALAEPKWWSRGKSYLGDFHPYKYLKFIEIAGYEIPNKISEWTDNQYKYLKVFKQVKAYFEAHPTEGVVFPSNVVWPV